MSLSPSDDLARTRVLFEQWRATRPGRSKIPDELWQAVVSLHGRYSASQLCRELHLSAGALRSHLQEAARAQPSSRPVFVPLSSPHSVGRLRRSSRPLPKRSVWFGSGPMARAYISVYRPPKQRSLPRSARRWGAPELMLQLVPQLRILLAVEPVDFRKYAQSIVMRS
jgi:hypothetical protein